MSQDCLGTCQNAVGKVQLPLALPFPNKIALRVTISMEKFLPAAQGTHLIRQIRFVFIVTSSSQQQCGVAGAGCSALRGGGPPPLGI